MKIEIVLCVALYLFAVFFLIGCAKQPEVITKVEFVEVKVPVKCNVELPPKPKAKRDFKSAQELANYYAILEARLKECVK
ncbi:hypothetical protein CCZ01_00940 [Helicobacter monodelphidis]|uniref:hypothetical protein n=1 Tax=Helicobacter sp. 15-1451 TaxID=2004995 RepID=UPI000DCBD04C|nr:hypothetical protein [Helicobacter sp. 15-1451]RAX59332.1 hypothetical protein CCZ01_00940 [Helicobacter sp. 15-1451]